MSSRLLLEEDKYDVNSDVSEDNIKALGINKKADDIQEMFVIRDAATKKDVGTKMADYFLVNTSGKVIDSKSKNKDGNDLAVSLYLKGTEAILWCIRRD